jgi:hypothetical protein
MFLFFKVWTLLKKKYFWGQWHLQYLECNVIQLYIPHNYYLWYDLYSFFLQNFLKPRLWNKIYCMPLTYIMTNQKDNICHVKSGYCVLCNFSDKKKNYQAGNQWWILIFPPSVIFAYYSPIHSFFISSVDEIFYTNKITSHYT